jgi:hypothetical protein
MNKSNRKLTLEEAIENFMEKVSPEPMSGCWIWMGNCSKSGYGKVKINQKDLRAHRAAWILFRGSIPDGLVLCHKCDIRPCVNPEHLFPGSLRDNTQDMIRKGRYSHRSCANHPDARLSLSQVGEIRQRYEKGNGTILAKEFGVSSTSIYSIINGNKWKSAWFDDAVEHNKKMMQEVG